MKLHTAKSWDEMLLRVLQSWADSAAWKAPLDANDEYCFGEGACTRDDLVQLAEESDQTVAAWPHWMRCNLSYLLTDLKLAVQDQVRDRPHYDATVFHYFYGSGTIPTRERSQEVCEAMEIMDLNTRLFYIWIQNELEDLGDWPRKVHERLFAEETFTKPGN